MQFHDMINSYNKSNIKGPHGELFTEFEKDRKLMQLLYLDKRFKEEYD